MERAEEAGADAADAAADILIGAVSKEGEVGAAGLAKPGGDCGLFVGDSTSGATANGALKGVVGEMPTPSPLPRIPLPLPESRMGSGGGGGGGGADAPAAAGFDIGVDIIILGVVVDSGGGGSTIGGEVTELFCGNGGGAVDVVDEEPAAAAAAAAAGVVKTEAPAPNGGDAIPINAAAAENLTGSVDVAGGGRVHARLGSVRLHRVRPFSAVGRRRSLA